ncbi:MAG TPA: hypothetical protein DIT55_06850 [Spirochaetaceae bacterium]|nr:hypothetical protein [Spirochaetaceae bacterium]
MEAFREPGCPCFSVRIEKTERTLRPPSHIRGKHKGICGGREGAYPERTFQEGSGCFPWRKRPGIPSSCFPDGAEFFQRVDPGIITFSLDTARRRRGIARIETQPHPVGIAGRDAFSGHIVQVKWIEGSSRQELPHTAARDGEYSLAFSTLYVDEKSIAFIDSGDAIDSLPVLPADFIDQGFEPQP